MPQTVLKAFSYVAISEAGTRVQDTMQATSESDVITALHRAGYTPLSVKEHSMLRGGLSLQGLWAVLNKHEPRFKTQQLSAFTRQLHQMLKAGISISASLNSLAEDQKDEAISEMLHTIAERLTSGSSVSAAFEGFPKAFDHIFLAYMQAAEESGDLVEVTSRLVQIVDKRAEIQRKVKGVTMYPILVGAAVLMMLAAIIMFLVPRYAGIYKSFGAKLPAPTLFLVALSRVFPLVAMVIVGLGIAFVAWNKSQAENFSFGKRFDQVKFRIPIMGKLFHKLVLMRFCNTAGGANLAGVQTHDALELAGKASGSRWVRSVVPDMQDAVRSGRMVSTALVAHPDLFPANMRKMVITGEETGELGPMLASAGRALEDEIDVIIATMAAKLEVALLIFMGVSVGAVLVALYLPILSLTTTVSDGYGF